MESSGGPQANNEDATRRAMRGGRKGGRALYGGLPEAGPPGFAPRVLERTMSIIVKHRTDLDLVAERVGVKLGDGLFGRQAG